MASPSAENLDRLTEEKNIWLATTRPEGEPHLVPVWFVWHEDVFFICVSSTSVKYHNVLQNPKVSLALEDGSSPLICEGTAQPQDRPWPQEVLAEFKRKYDWEIETDSEYDSLLRITPGKWLSW